ncbi:MAG: hypothetical protein ABI579_03205 [Candidatus Sumerlaeota bacterium]
MLFEIKEVTVTGDNIVGRTGFGSCDDDVVVGIGQNDGSASGGNLISRQQMALSRQPLFSGGSDAFP